MSASRAFDWFVGWLVGIAQWPTQQLALAGHTTDDRLLNCRSIVVGVTLAFEITPATIGVTTSDSQ